MSDPTLAAVILAAGSGARLLPLTISRPKALCPVNNIALVDHAIEYVSAVSKEIAVNAWSFHEQMVTHLNGRVHVSVEEGEALGTAGALGYLKPWINGRDLIIHNADSWHTMDLGRFAENWDRQRPRLLVIEEKINPDFGNWRFCGISLMPWSIVSKFEAKPTGLWEVCWRDLWAKNELELATIDGMYFDCGTPAEYLAANLAANNGKSVIGQGAVVEGEIERCVVWPNGRVGADERLVEVIRLGKDITVDASDV